MNNAAAAIPLISLGATETEWTNQYHEEPLPPPDHVFMNGRCLCCRVTKQSYIDDYSRLKCTGFQTYPHDDYVAPLEEDIQAMLNKAFGLPGKLP